MGVALLRSKPTISLKRGKIGPRSLLMTNRKSHTRFRLCQNQRPWMTLKCHYALCFKTHASLGAHHENLNEVDPHYQPRRSSPMTLYSGNVRFMLIFTGVPWRGASNNSGVIKNVDFRAFGRYVFGTLGNKANIII